jgi:glycine/sarcosine N-methyltransferase
MQDVTEFYDTMANDYHLIFADWAQSVERQSAVLDALIRERLQTQPVRVLDCACGIGTQALGLAKRGYTVHATDISAAEIERAQREAEKMGLQLTFGVADMRTLNVQGQYDVVIAFDNALPHLLTDDDLAQAASALYAATQPGGIFMASIRDYDALLAERPQLMSERVMDSPEGKRVTLQVWDWEGEQYTVTQFFLVRQGDWQMRHYTTRYRALRRATLSDALQAAGFSAVEWLMPESSGYYQPIVIARRLP